MLITPNQNLQTVLDTAAPGDTLYLGEGDFRAKVLITTPGLRIQGAGAGKTRILWDDYAKKIDENGLEYVTFRTWTVAVCADSVTITDLSIINDALYPEKKGQEVALTVYGDDFLMERCTLSSTQDTLFAGPLPPDLIQRYEGFLPDCLRKGGPCRQTYRNCLIEGTVDFIFGSGEAFFDHCEIRSLVDARNCGYVAAPSHSLSQEKGFLFSHCRLTKEEGVTPGSIYLARPWRDYGLCTFSDCTYEDHISPLGFDKWNDTHRDQTARFYEKPLQKGRVPWARE